jgi:NADH-quinone oxidoreductase subunit J
VIAQVTSTSVAFWLLAPVMVLAALGMILVRKAVHAALLLAVVMVCLAVQYAAQDAPFLFVVQIFVYMGAILMLFIFVLMLVGVDAADSLVETIRGQRLLAGVAFLGFAVLLVFAVGDAAYDAPQGLADAQRDGNPKAVAQLLFGKYVFAFEVTSALLITAALGAMMMTYRGRLSAKLTQRELAGERIRRYAEEGVHPGPLPTPGVLARHNAVDTPALLPDGSIEPKSVSRVLQARGTVFPVSEERKDVEDVKRLDPGTTGKLDTDAATHDRGGNP